MSPPGSATTLWFEILKSMTADGSVTLPLATAGQTHGAPEPATVYGALAGPGAVPAPAEAEVWEVAMGFSAAEREFPKMMGCDIW